MKQPLPRNEVMQINRIKAQAADDMARDYIALKDASAITGLNSSQLLAFCTAHQVRHHKHGQRWMIHQQELITAFRQHGQ